MIRKIIFYIFSCMFITGLAVSGAGASPVKVLIDDAVKYALDNNRDYRIARMKAREADEKVNAVWGQLMPSLESEASLTRQYAENGFMSLNDGQLDIKLVQIRFGINPGVFYNSLQASREAYIIAEEEMRRIRNDVIYSVIRSYFDFLLADEMIKLRRESMRLYEANFKDVKNLYNKGSVPKYELLQAQVELKNQEPLLLDAENSRRTALEMFNYHLGLDELIYEPDSTILDSDVKAVSSENKEGNIQRLIQLALANRPEIIQVAKKGEVARHSAELNSSYYLWPTFSVAGCYGYTKYDPNTPDAGMFSSYFSGITGDDQWQNTWQVRIAATYRWSSLIPSDSTRSMEREERIRMREAEEEILKIRRLVAISVKNSYNKLVTSYIPILSQRDNVATAEEGLRIARESYRAGVIRNSELLSAQVNLTAARTGYINAVYSYYTSLAELKRETCAEKDSVILEDKPL